MRTVAAAAMMVAVLSGAFAQQQPAPKPESQALTGRVRSCKEEQAQYSLDRSGRRTEGPRVTQAVTTYDGRGNMVERVQYSRGVPSGKRVYTYVGGRLSVETEYDSNGSLFFRRSNVYNTDGTLREQHFESSDQAPYRFVYYYGANGKVAWVAQLDSDGSETGGGWEYLYDGAGNNTSFEIFGEGGSPIQRYVYTYDSTGHQTQMLIYNYDTDGTVADYSGEVYVYDDRGRMTEVGWYSNANLTRSQSYTYDHDRRLVETTVYGADGTPTGRVSYSYDHVGNWVMMIAQTIVRGNASANYVRYRTFEYDQ